MDGEHPRAIGYVRVSTDEQAVSQLGLDAQRSAIRAEAARRGWKLLDIIEDAGFSGKDLRRPGMAEVLERLRHNQVDVLVAAKLDRLGRSLADLAGLIDLAARQRWSLVALDVGVDTGTLSGKAMAQMMGVFAELERGMIGLRTRDALQAARTRGIRIGRPPAVPDTVLLRIRAERASGHSLRVIAKGLNHDAVPTAHGGRAWYPSTVQRILKRADVASVARTPPEHRAFTASRPLAPLADAAPSRS